MSGNRQKSNLFDGAGDFCRNFCAGRRVARDKFADVDYRYAVHPDLPRDAICDMRDLRIANPKTNSDRNLFVAP